MNRALVSSSLLAVGCSVTLTSRSEGPAVEADHQTKVKQILATYDDLEDFHQYREFYRSLFAACDATRLVALNSDKNDSIATQSAWEAVTSNVPEEDGGEVHRPDRNKLHWFLGFLEGRNRITAPEWWREIANIYPGSPDKPPYHGSGIKWVACPLNASVSEKGRVVTYRSGADSVVVPEVLLNRADSGELLCNISCAFSAKHCFVAVHGDVGYPHDVACIDRRTKKIVWKSTACGCWWGGTSGIHESWVSLIATDDGRLFVFGLATTGFYAHSFDASDGTTLVRFSNNY